MYGMSPYGLSKELGISVLRRITYKRVFFQISGVSEYFKEILEAVERMVLLQP